MSKKRRKSGHYCKICSEYKSNESFSGKGHANHICKRCSKKSDYQLYSDEFDFLEECEKDMEMQTDIDDLPF